MPPTRSFRMPRNIFQIPPLSPSDRADLEISALSSRPEFQTECVFGGPMPKEMVARNKRRALAYRTARAKVIAKHGVFDEYLQPLLDDVRTLRERLAETRDEIAELRGLRAGKK